MSFNTVKRGPITGCLRSWLPSRAPNGRFLSCKGSRNVRLAAVVPPSEEKSGGVLERPDFDRSSESKVLPDQYYGSTEPPGNVGLGGGDWRLMLLDSPTHTEKLIVQTLTAVVANVNEQQAKNCFHTSKQLGQAMITSCIKEHAEFFAQQLNRQGVRSIIEPDTTTL